MLQRRPHPIASTPPEAEATASRRRSTTFRGGFFVASQRLPELPRRFNEEVVRAAIPSDRGKVDLGGDGDFTVAAYSGEKDRELVGRDPYPLAQENDEAPEIHGGVNHDSAEVDLSVTIGADDSEGRVSTVMHHLPTIGLALCVMNRTRWFT
ncbi:hybrid sensor histidine kinase/response regulator [Sesbania bispinosa]|nr:hybrid sensor histidine kinase/response regulator [Sesbania bispinosa]